MDFTGESSGSLVVEGGITTDSVAPRIVLTMSGDFFSKKPPVPVTNAIVTITDGQEIFPLYESGNGVYNAAPGVKGIAGNTYKLSIYLGDTAYYEASQTIQPLPDMDSIRFENSSGFDMYKGIVQGYKVLYYGTEPQGVGDYYLWLLYLNDKLYTDSLYKKVFTSDEFMDGSYLHDYKLFIIPAEDLPTDTVVVRLEMRSVSKEYYDYATGLMLETHWKGTPWDGPPANAKGNVSNDALGFFTAEDVKTISKLLIKDKK